MVQTPGVKDIYLLREEKMEIEYFKLSLFLLRISLLLQMFSKNAFAVELGKEGNKEATDLNQVHNETDLNSRMTSIEAKSKKQEVEIEVLTKQLEEEKKFTKQLSGRISQLESPASESFLKKDHLLERSKRPYRLLQQ